MTKDPDIETELQAYDVYNSTTAQLTADMYDMTKYRAKVQARYDNYENDLAAKQALYDFAIEFAKVNVKIMVGQKEVVVKEPIDFTDNDLKLTAQQVDVELLPQNKTVIA